MTEICSYVIPNTEASVTFGSHVDFRRPTNTHNEMMFDAIREKTKAGIGDEDLRNLALDFLDFLEAIVTSESITADLPRLICDFKHREAYYEWIFSHFRMGFVIDKDENENGWFLVLDETLGDKTIMDRFDRSFMDAMAFLKFHVQ